MFHLAIRVTVVDLLSWLGLGGRKAGIVGKGQQGDGCVYSEGNIEDDKRCIGKAVGEGSMTDRAEKLEKVIQKRVLSRGVYSRTPFVAS